MNNYKFPTVLKLRNQMQDFSKILYTIWRHQISLRLQNLIFKGEICIDINNDYHFDSDSDNIIQKELLQVISRLPNRYIKTALSSIQDELDYLGYDYEFKFGDVIENNQWVLTYNIELPEDPNENDVTEFYDPDSETTSSQTDDSLGITPI